MGAGMMAGATLQEGHHDRCAGPPNYKSMSFEACKQRAHAEQYVQCRLDEEMRAINQQAMAADERRHRRRRAAMQDGWRPRV